LPDWPLLDRTERAEVTARSVARVGRAIGLAPLHVRAGVAVVSVALGLCLVALGIGAGGPRVLAYRAGRFYGLLQKLPGPAASVVRLYRSMTLLAFYEMPQVAKSLDKEAAK
jgi:hypothetical protein